MVLLSEVSSSICFLVIDSCFLGWFGNPGFARLVLTSTSGLGKNGSNMLPLKDRVLDELDFGRATSDLLKIFPQDNSTVVLEVFIIFWFNFL